MPRTPASASISMSFLSSGAWGFSWEQSPNLHSERRVRIEGHRPLQCVPRLDQLREKLDEPVIFDLVNQLIRRTIDENCVHSTVGRGILPAVAHHGPFWPIMAYHCLSWPIMGALYPDVLERRVEVIGLFYARFMDDWGMLAPTRWTLHAGSSAGEPEAGAS